MISFIKRRLLLAFIALSLPATLASAQSETPPQKKSKAKTNVVRSSAQQAVTTKNDSGAREKSEKDSEDKISASETVNREGESQETTPITTPKITFGTERRLPNDRVPVNHRSMTREGATGLAQVYSADTGPQGTIRFGVQVSGFSSSEFLVPGFEDQFTRGDLSIAYTPIELVELFMNTRSLSYYHPLATPTYVQGQGDLKLGAKVGHFWGSIGAGLSLSAQLVSDPKGNAWLAAATNFEARALFTTDLTRRTEAIPFRFLLDVQFTKENTEVLTKHLGEEPSLIQEWGYQSARYDRLMLNFGIEVPTKYVSPFIEYHIGTPFLVEMPRMGRYSNIFAFESVPHFVAAGLRGFPLEELAIEIGGTMGMSDAPFTGVTATPPWTLWTGVSYTLDPRPKVIEREVKIEPPPPPKSEPAKPLGALLSLAVVDAETQTAIQNAELSFLDADLSPQRSDKDGFFKGYRLLPKTYVISVTAEGYQSKKVRLSIDEGQAERRAKLKLKRDPKSKLAKFTVTYRAPEGDPRADARLELSLIGSQSVKATLTATTPLSLELSPGEYVLVVRGVEEQVYYEVITLGSAGEGSREITPQLLISPQGGGGEDSKTQSKSTKKGGALKGSTQWVKYDLKKKRLSTKRAISFDGNSSNLTRGSKNIVRGLASFLKEEARIKQIVVMVHTHSRGEPKVDKRLGYQRAEAIKTILKAEGVEENRVRLYSYGSDKNLASNLSRRGRERNQRVMLKIKAVDL